MNFSNHFSQFCPVWFFVAFSFCEFDFCAQFCVCRKKYSFVFSEFSSVVFAFCFHLLIRFSLILAFPGPPKVSKSLERSLKNSQNDVLGTVVKQKLWTWRRNRVRTAPTSIETDDQMVIDFDSIWARFGLHVGLQNPSKTNPKSTKKLSNNDAKKRHEKMSL